MMERSKRERRLDELMPHVQQGKPVLQLVVSLNRDEEEEEQKVKGKPKPERYPPYEHGGEG